MCQRTKDLSLSLSHTHLRERESVCERERERESTTTSTLQKNNNNNKQNNNSGWGGVRCGSKYLYTATFQREGNDSISKTQFGQRRFAASSLLMKAMATAKNESLRAVVVVGVGCGVAVGGGVSGTDK